MKKRLTRRKIFFVILALIILLGIIISYSLKDKKDFVEECRIDSDCVKVQTTCCSCNWGGEEKCVSKEEIGFYQKQLENCAKNSLCIAMYACTIKSCGCIEGECAEK